jgi:integrase
MLTIDRAIDVFLARGFKETTRSRYGRILDRFADRFPRGWDVSKVTEDDCLAFIAGFRHLAVGTQAHAEAVVASFFGWLYRSRKIKVDPMARVERTRRLPASDLDVVTVSSRDVPRLLLAAKPGTELNCIAIAAYLGPRRRAIATLRLSDYDRERGRIRFYEKGGKTIWKPVPDELARILEQSISAGHIVNPSDYLVPPEGPLVKPGDRDDRVIWRVVKRVAKRAGVKAHVHALRAAFAVYFLETHGRDAISLQELLGHKSIETTKVYLRKMDKDAAMETVRDLSWAAAQPGNTDDLGIPQIAGEWLSSSQAVGAGGFEPPSPDSRGEQRPGTQHDVVEVLKERIPKPKRENAKDLSTAKGTEL